MSGKKRKSVTLQPTISKFFKPTAQSHSKKKVAIIQVLDDGDEVQIISENKICKTENKNISFSTIQNGNVQVLSNAIEKPQTGFVSESFKESKITVSLNKSIDKLKVFNIENDIPVQHKDVRNNMIVENVHEEPPKSHANCEDFPALSNYASAYQNKIDLKKVNEPTRVTDTRKSSYTPLEKQVIAIKEKYADVLLFVECGYKYRFFGQDAEIASKELNIYCHMDHNFMTASIPTHRLTVHLSRLVEKGYKVGVVRQTETAALKAAGDNKNTPFTRMLTNLYTKATFIDKEDCDDGKNTGHYLACINTKQSGTDCATAMLFVNPTTGDIVYSVEAGNETSTLETMFHVLKPCEIILLDNFKNERILKFIDSYKKIDETIIRIENIKDGGFNTGSCHDELFEKLAGKLEHNSLLGEKLTNKLEVNCLLGCIKIIMSYLKQYELEQILISVENYRVFASLKTCMKLDSSIISNLELFQNNVDNQVKGSLFWILDHNATIFGKRLLKRWLNEPLLDVEKINERLVAVTELKDIIHINGVESIKKQLHWTVDLEKGLTSIYYGKVTPEKFIKTVEHLEKLRALFLKYCDIISSHVTSNIILDVFNGIPTLLGAQLLTFLNELNKSESTNPTKSNLFKSPENYPALHECHKTINDIESKMNEHLKKYIRPKLQNYNLIYKTISNTEYLIEVRNSNLKIVPNDWIKISSTKQFSRYRSPYLEGKFKELCQVREELITASNEAWLEFLDKFLSIYQPCREAVQKIAIFDCLLSLATVAKQPGYCKPIYRSDYDGIEIIEGRHPVIDLLLGESKQYVGNDTHMSRDQKVLLISGPNMGGKSSYIKQVAIICILAQMGCYVPAVSAELSILDGVYTRMGGSDDITRGKSTFMIELEEASNIMNNVTEKSLVIMDELGRGTSTHDGTAIAYATLEYFIKDVKAYTLFVTHYPVLTELEKLSNGYVKNYHMAFMNVNDKDGGEYVCEYDGDKNEDTTDNIKDSIKSSEGQSRRTNADIDSIIFLYKLRMGAANKSYGLNVARLAGISSSILAKASFKSLEMEDKVHKQIPPNHVWMSYCYQCRMALE